MRALLISLIILTTSCEYNKYYNNRESDKTEADLFIQDFYANIEEKQYPEAFSHIHPMMWRRVDSIKFSQYFVNLTNVLSGLKERRIDHWKTEVEVGYEPISSYSLYYLDKYENFELKVTVHLQKDGYRGMKIIGYNANTEKFD